MIRLGFLPSARAIGLALGAAASLIELGPIVALLRDDRGLIAVLCAGFAYQAGGAVARFVPGETWIWAALVAACATVLIAGSLEQPCWFFAISGVSWALQAARRRHGHTFPEGSPPTAQKRAARVLGFIAASLVPLWLSIATTVSLVILTAKLCKFTSGASTPPRLYGRRIEAIMILHQVHYFSYCYAVLLILANTAGGAAVVGFWFGLGWITYLSAERLWCGVGLARALVLGHLFVASTLICMAAVGSLGWAVVLLWSMTGLGGGTVFCLTRIHQSAGLPIDSLELAEDIGHLGGVAIALLAATLFGAGALDLVTIAAAFALATIIVFLLDHSRANSSPISKHREA